MVASTLLNASVELARAIASMNTILRTGPVIASALDDQAIRAGDWPSGPPRRWSGHATLAIRNADHNLATAVVQRRTSASREGEAVNGSPTVLNTLMARGIVPGSSRGGGLAAHRDHHPRAR